MVGEAGTMEQSVQAMIMTPRAPTPKESAAR